MCYSVVYVAHILDEVDVVVIPSKYRVAKEVAAGGAGCLTTVFFFCMRDAFRSYWGHDLQSRRVAGVGHKKYANINWAGTAF